MLLWLAGELFTFCRALLLDFPLLAKRCCAYYFEDYSEFLQLIALQHCVIATPIYNMRFSALIPVVLSAAAFILTMLCLFAGSKPGFMEDYAVVTVS